MTPNLALTATSFLSCSIKTPEIRSAFSSQINSLAGDDTQRVPPSFVNASVSALTVAGQSTVILRGTLPDLPTF